MKDLLRNKWVLNIVAFIALLNLISFIITGNINSTIFFIVLALLVRYFSKNMIIVLGVPIVFVNLFSFKNYREGLETQDASGADATKIKTDVNNKKTELSAAKNDASGNTTSGKTTPDENFEVGRAKNKGANKIDYATTIEDAYDDLNKILGSDGIQRLTDDTQHLMKQQMDLAKSMEAMTPLIQNIMPMAEKAQQMMKSMDGGSNGLGNIMEMAKKMSSGLNGAKQ
jgi:hypothetical protein